MADDLFVPNPVIQSMLLLDDARDVREIAMKSETLHIGRTISSRRCTLRTAPTANPKACGNCAS